MNVYGFEVPPLSRKQIRAHARRLRACIGWAGPYFPIVDFIELALPKLIPGFYLEVCAARELDENHAVTYPNKKIIRVREDVYDGACADRGRDRLTLAHEVGHLLLHADIPLARSSSRTGLPPYRDSEWQANCFGGELLVPADHIHLCQHIHEVAPLFRVSLRAAEVQWRACHRDGLVKE